MKIEPGYLYHIKEEFFSDIDKMKEELLSEDLVVN